MKRNKLMLAALTLALMLAALVVPTATISAPATQNVNVVNTTANPVPTVAQGTTAVSGSVNVSNTPNVNVANTPTVNIARTLVHDGKSFSLPPNPNVAFEFAIPANVVLTDVVLSLNAPSLATEIFVAETDN
jgi:hypothetical protein